MIQQEDILYGRIATSGQPGPRGPKGDPGGVTTWNTREGEVVPQHGDYNLNMVGAEFLTNTEIDSLWNSNL